VKITHDFALFLNECTHKNLHTEFGSDMQAPLSFPLCPIFALAP